MPIPVDPPQDPRQAAIDRVWRFVNTGTTPTLEELRAALTGTTPSA